MAPKTSQDAHFGVAAQKNTFKWRPRVAPSCPEAFRDTIRNFVSTEVMPHADKWDEAGIVPWELHEKLGALG